MARAAPQAGFQPTRPLRGATRAARHAAAYSIISTHAPLAGRDPVECSSSDADGISTHAPLAGRDRRARVDDGKPRLISTHAPLAGRDLQCRTIPASGRDFNPRAPCGARQDLCLSVLAQLNFNPRAPCGARQCGFGTNYYQFNISTHAPLAGRDARWSTAPKAKAVFQPTRPLRGATANPTLSHTCHPYFNPRAPCGARRSRLRPQRISSRFQPTRPLRGATRGTIQLYCNHKTFQPTRPLRGATDLGCTITSENSKFQPTRPLRGATLAGGLRLRGGSISTHAPLAGRDGGVDVSPMSDEISTHAPLAGRDGIPAGHGGSVLPISTHAPLAGRDTTGRKARNINKLFQPTRPLRGATWSCLFIARAVLISTHAPLAGRDCKSVQITMHIFAITDKFQMLLHRMPTVRAFCSFLMQENHADFGCEPPK